jgi:hypothetical protein
MRDGSHKGTGFGEIGKQVKDGARYNTPRDDSELMGLFRDVVGDGRGVGLLGVGREQVIRAEKRKRGKGRVTSAGAPTPAFAREPHAGDVSLPLFLSPHRLARISTPPPVSLDSFLFFPSLAA